MIVLDCSSNNPNGTSKAFSSLNACMSTPPHLVSQRKGCEFCFIYVDSFIIFFFIECMHFDWSFYWAGILICPYWHFWLVKSPWEKTQFVLLFHIFGFTGFWYLHYEQTNRKTWSKSIPPPLLFISLELKMYYFPLKTWRNSIASLSCETNVH